MSNRTTDDPVDLEELFDTDVDHEPTPRRVQLKRSFDLYVAAPARVAIHDWRALVGMLIVGAFLLVGTVGVWLVEQPISGDAPILVQPFQDLSYILGTDTLGRPIGAQLIHATPGMLKMIFAGAVVSIGLAALVGVLSGFMRGNIVDTVLMAVTDVIITIPGLPLVIVLIAIFQPESPYVVGVLLGLDNWPGLARTVRSQVLSIREDSYVEASQIMGLPTSTILRRDIIGQLMPYITVNSALASRRIIFESVGLYFLGILPFTSFNWGVLMNLAYQGGALTDPQLLHWLVFPMLTIILMAFGLVLLSQGMDSVFNVRLRARHATTTGDEATGEE
ncbi:ABC transporter permease [Candidatus Halobonum tyrrellensis]|uniref:Binding-protein-dependent transporters inner membrane component n=1 Tax=Candidatus Halobonum tyrrellensis G22 TaxID=1324957 RepID=V4HGR4_9EURY|nr:ABC transporter permease [Candidatus Halobonum tyrrellensis]ESP87009.1 binding-protein-dependent transporters inner membrane component [Candidatus Halobonum tyrrellensis G22]